MLKSVKIKFIMSQKALICQFLKNNNLIFQWELESQMTRWRMNFIQNYIHQWLMVRLRLLITKKDLEEVHQKIKLTRLCIKSFNQPKISSYLPLRLMEDKKSISYSSRMIELKRLNTLLSTKIQM